MTKLVPQSQSTSPTDYRKLVGPKVSSARGAVVAHSYIAEADLNSALSYIENRTKINKRPLKRLHVLLRNRPKNGDSRRVFKDDPSRDVQVVSTKSPKGKPLVIAFTARTHMLGGPLNVIQCWFEHLDVNVVYLKDLDDLYYLNGIKSFGSYNQTIIELGNIIEELEARSVHCVGTSAGGFGALNLGLDLQAKGILCLAGPSRIDESLNSLIERWKSKVSSSAGPAPELLHPKIRYMACQEAPKVRLVYGNENARDRAEATRLLGIKNVEHLELKDCSEHSVVVPLVERRQFLSNLRWLTGQSTLERLRLHLKRRLELEG